MGRTDVAATGTLAAGEFVKWDSTTRVDGGIFVYSIDSVGGALNGTIGCDLPAQGIASDVSISQDAKLLAWRDDGGVKVAGAPTGQVLQENGSSICTLASAPVVISATGRMPSIGGADVDVLRPPAAAPPPSGGGPTTPGPGTGTPPTTSTPAAAPTFAALPRATTRLLSKGLAFTVRVGAPGKVTLTLTVPAKRLGRTGKPIVVATGSATAGAAGNVKVKLRLTAIGREKLKRLRGARLTLTVRHGGKRSTKTLVVKRG